MLRKLILLAIASMLAKKMMEGRRMSAPTPFPTSSRPPEGYNA